MMNASWHFLSLSLALLLGTMIVRFSLHCRVYVYLCVYTRKYTYNPDLFLRISCSHVEVMIMPSHLPLWDIMGKIGVTFVSRHVRHEPSYEYYYTRATYTWYSEPYRFGPTRMIGSFFQIYFIHSVIFTPWNNFTFPSSRISVLFVKIVSPPSKG